MEYNPLGQIFHSVFKCCLFPAVYVKVGSFWFYKEFLPLLLGNLGF